MARRASLVLATVGAVAGATLLIVVAVGAGHATGSAMRARPIASAPPTSPRTFVVTSPSADGVVERTEIPIGEVRCTLTREVAMISASSGGRSGAFQADGAPDDLTRLWLRFDDRVFIATGEAALSGDRLNVSGLSGQINEWTTGTLPGPVLTEGATLSGTIACDRVRRP